MRWQGRRESDNVEDRRNSSGGPSMGGPGFRLPSGKGGLILLIVVLVAGYYGVDLTGLMTGQPVSQQQSTRSISPNEDEAAKFTSVILATTEDTWGQQFEKMGKTYQQPKLVMYRGMTRTGCGAGQSIMGPFYCPADGTVYIDLSFYDDMKDKLGADGDFAQGYVIAHEVGHHVQKLLGIEPKVRQLQQNATQAEVNRLSVRMELQADCFAGVWGHSMQQQGVLETGDLEEALNAAQAIGDDRLQQQSQGRVVPDSFTHGTSQQRYSWFKRGFDSGDPAQCNTFVKHLTSGAGMAELTAFHTLTAQMKREGIRRLLVLSGEEGWCFDHALKLRDALPGDWLWISPQPDAENHCSPSALQTLLGREFRHAVFDARHGFDAAAFAALSGTLKAGSWLVLLLPVWEEWENQPDTDSLRWSDCPDPIATPHFVQHFKRVLTADNDAILWRQNQPFSLAHFTPRTDWHTATGAPQPEQQQLLQQLLTMPSGVAAVTAARGRGKSALAGQLISRIAGSAIVTAPAKAATDVLAQFAGEKFRFIAPDALLASDEQADWLVVDEAAAIPAPLLHQLVSRFPRTLLTTTVQGYEGTGRGFC